MIGPYDFTSEKIDEVVEKMRLGNYVLGRVDVSDGAFIVNWVGRSDTDLNKEMKERLKFKYPNFKFSYADSKKAAFEKECCNYHDFGGKYRLNNKIHPDRPNGTTHLDCPVAGCTELPLCRLSGTIQR
jgi:hypothetical protein